MSRYYKVRIIHTEIHNQRERETFIIRPEKSTFDSFMTEVCARLPELFYQPFKLYYTDAFGEFITIFNWLDFGIFFMQNILDVYLMKIDTKSNLHFRTIWSMPMPTASRSLAYEEFIQPAYQLSQQTCFDFLRYEHNQGQKGANAQVDAQANNTVSTEQQKTLIDFSAAAATRTNPNFSFNTLSEGIDMANSATTMDPTKVSSATEEITRNTEIDFNKTATNTSGNDAFQNVNTNDNILSESNKNSLNDAIEQVHKRIAEWGNIFKKIEVETPNDFNLVENTCNNVKVPKNRNKGRKYKSKTEIVEPAQIIGDPITEWRNETFSLGDYVEVCAGDWIGLIGRITAINGQRIKVIGCIDGMEYTKPLRFRAGQLCSYNKANQNDEKMVSLDEKEPTVEVVQYNDDNNVNVATTIDTCESDTLKEETIFHESSTQFTEGQLCNFAKVNQNDDKIIQIDEEKLTPEVVQSNDSNNENVDTNFDAHEPDTLKEATIFDESSTQSTSGQLCSYAKADHNDEKLILLDEEPTPEVVQSNDNNDENVATTIDTYESDTLKEEIIFDESSTQLTSDQWFSYAKAKQNDEKLISLDQKESTLEVETYESDTQKEESILDEISTKLANFETSEAKDDDNLQKLNEDESNVLTKSIEDAIIQFREKRKGGSCDSVDLITIEDTESSIVPEVDEKDENVTLNESGQESPISREWTFVETAEYAETPVTVDTLATVTGTIPKTTSKEDINHDTIRRRILPEIPVSNVASSGHIAEALSIMMAMGFTNDGDRLYRLLESVDGNISSAFDIVE